MQVPAIPSRMQYLEVGEYIFEKVAEFKQRGTLIITNYECRNSSPITEDQQML
jgi:hypothetical protein